MGKPSVVVAFKASSGQREAIESVLRNIADIRFISDFDDASRSEVLKEADVLFAGGFSSTIRPSDHRFLQQVMFIQTVPAGADKIPFDELPERALIASNAGAFADPMAEHVMAMTLALAKNMIPQNHKLKLGSFDHATLSRELRRMTAGIIGFGGIGRATARLMRPFGMRIMAINHSGKSDELTDFVGTLHDLDTVLRESDVVVMSIPLMKSTHGLVGKNELAVMKPKAILINVGRGQLIDEEALYEHARSQPEFLVGLDVWWEEPFREGRFHTDYPFLELPNVLGSPHNSGLVAEMMVRATKQAAENIKRFIEDQPVSGILRREDYIA